MSATNLNRSKEPRGLPSAVGEVELPPRVAEAARTQRQRELQGDAEGPTTTSGTHEATSLRCQMCAGATLAHRRTRAPRDKPSRRTTTTGHTKKKRHPSFLEQPLFVSFTPSVGSERRHHSSPTATSSAGVTRTNVGGAYVGDFSSNTTCKRLQRG